eukprot:scaffold210185_cov36-Tisochrysis_lutea.AAC.1
MHAPAVEHDHSDLLRIHAFRHDSFYFFLPPTGYAVGVVPVFLSLTFPVKKACQVPSLLSVSYAVCSSFLVTGMLVLVRARY